MDRIDPKRRANRKAGQSPSAHDAGPLPSRALVPLYDVLCRAAGIGNAEAKAASRSFGSRSIQIEKYDRVLAEPASVGSFDSAASRVDAHSSGKLYDTLFHAKNLTQNASVAQAVPSISPTARQDTSIKPSAFASVRRNLRQRGVATWPVRSSWMRG